MDPSGVYLKDSDDESMYFPTENGSFNLSQDGVLPYSTLMVEGRAFSDVGQGSIRTPTRNNFAAQSLSSSSSSNTPGGSHQASSSPSTAYQGSAATMFRSARRPPPSFTLKLVQANITRTGRRVEFHVTDQTFVTITESSAHTDFLATAAC